MGYFFKILLHAPLLVLLHGKVRGVVSDLLGLLLFLKEVLKEKKEIYKKRGK